MWGKGFVLMCFIFLGLSTVCYGQFCDNGVERDSAPALLTGFFADITAGLIVWPVTETITWPTLEPAPEPTPKPRALLLEGLMPEPTLKPVTGSVVETTAEPTPEPTAGPGVTSGTEPKPTPEPYEGDEFPQWINDLRRAEVIMVGSFPFTMFLAIEIFDIYRYVSFDFDPAYSPWPFKSPQAVPYEKDEKINVIITAVSFSVCIAIIDYIIVRVNRGKKPAIKQKK
ncbi:MAG: hypothetical protein JXB88_07250 [Spirochaetales bacterium]|nr:hypothetical protein [Spirochaetales bacterium]